MKFKTYLEENEQILIFCDMDGVLTDFHRHFLDATGKRINDIPKPKSYKMIADLSVEWWATLPWMKDGKELWAFLTKITEKGNLHILTTPSMDKEKKSHEGKRIWLDEKGITQQIGKDHCIIDTNKHHHAVDGVKCILIDDTPKKIDKWTDAGGIGILHTDAESTIRQLNNKHL